MGQAESKPTQPNIEIRSIAELAQDQHMVSNQTKQTLGTDGLSGTESVNSVS